MRAVGNNHKYDFDSVDCQENVRIPGGTNLLDNQHNRVNKKNDSFLPFSIRNILIGVYIVSLLSK